MYDVSLIYLGIRAKNSCLSFVMIDAEFLHEKAGSDPEVPPWPFFFLSILFAHSSFVI
jgi:hypothetical protein